MFILLFIFFFYINNFIWSPFTFFLGLIVFTKVVYPVAPPAVPEFKSPNEQFGALLAPGAPLYSDRQQQLEKEKLDQLLQGEVFLRPSYAKVMQEPPEVVMANEVFRVVVAAFSENVSFLIIFWAEGLGFMD